MTQEATVPALLQLARSELAADRDAAEHIRNKWCNLLEQSLDGTERVPGRPRQRRGGVAGGKGEPR